MFWGVLPVFSHYTLVGLTTDSRSLDLGPISDMCGFGGVWPPKVGFLIWIDFGLIWDMGGIGGYSRIDVPVR